MTTGSSAFRKIGVVFLCLAFCVGAVGCGGESVDALVKEQKAIFDDMKAGKIQEMMPKQAALSKRVEKLSDAQKKEFAEKTAGMMLGNPADFLKGAGDMLKGIKMPQMP